MKVDEPEPEIVSDKSLPTPAILPGADAYSDVSYFYTNVLWGYPEPDLDSVKQIAKTEFFGTVGIFM